MSLVEEVKNLVDSKLELEDAVVVLREHNTALKFKVTALEKKTQRLETALLNLKDRLTRIASEESRRRISAQVHAANDSWLPNVVEKKIYDTAVDALFPVSLRLRARCLPTLSRSPFVVASGPPVAFGIRYRQSAGTAALVRSPSFLVGKTLAYPDNETF